MTSKSYDYTVVPPPEDYAPATVIVIVLTVTSALCMCICVCCVLYRKGFFKQHSGTNHRQMQSDGRSHTSRGTRAPTPVRMDHRESGEFVDVADLVSEESSEDSLDIEYRTDNIDDLLCLDDSEARTNTRLHANNSRHDLTRSATEEVISDRRGTNNSVAPPPLYHELDRICLSVSTESQSPPSYNDFMAKPEIYTQALR